MNIHAVFVLCYLGFVRSSYKTYQECKILSTKIKGHYLGEKRINSTENATYYHVSHIHECSHLCRIKTGCLALNFVNKTDINEKNCQLFQWLFSNRSIVFDRNATVIILYPEDCSTRSAPTKPETETEWNNPYCESSCNVIDFKGNRTCCGCWQYCGTKTCLTDKKDLNDLKTITENGTYYFNINNSRRIPFKIMIDIEGNIWIIIQQRFNGEIEFYRDWRSYKEGFGSTDKEFWLGNDIIHQLTKNNDKSLRVEIQRGSYRIHAEYTDFKIANEDDKYRLSVSGYSGVAGDYLEYHNGMEFSTSERDNDRSSGNCAEIFRGGWWFKRCYHSTLNGQYWDDVGVRFNGGILWRDHNNFAERKLYDQTIMMIKFKS